VTRLTAIVLLAALTIAAGAGASPVDRGRRVATGSVSFSSGGGSYYADGDGNRTQEWSLQPGGGVFVAHGVAVNLLASGTWFRQGGVVANHYEFGPTVEYYVDTVGDGEARGRSLPYVGAGVLWGRARSEAAGVETTWNSACMMLKAGLSWLLLDSVATDISVMHRFGTFEQKAPVDGAMRHGNRWTLHLGLKIFLP